MPIPVIQFPTESPETASPWLSAFQGLQQGIQAGQQIKSNYYKNKYAEPTLKQQLKELELKNQYYPQQMDVSLQNSLNGLGSLQQSMNRFGPATALRQSLNSMSPAAKSAWIAQNQDAYNSLLEAEKNAALQSQKPAPNVLSKYIQDQGQQQQIGTPLDNNQPNSQPLSEALTTLQRQNDMGIPITQQGQPSNEQKVNVVIDPVGAQNDIVRRASEDSANFAGLTNWEKSRYGAAKTLDNFFVQPQVLESLYQSTKYPGLGGWSSNWKDYVTNPREYNEYKVAVDKLPAIFSGSLAKLEGYPTSELGLTSAKDFLKVDGLAPGSSRADADKVVDSQLDLVDQENEAIRKEYERYFPHQDEQISHKKLMQEYRKYRNKGISSEESYQRALSTIINPESGQPSLKTQLQNMGQIKEDEKIAASNGKKYTREELLAIAKGGE